MNSSPQKDNLNQVLLELVQAHGYEAELRGEEVVVEGQLVCSVQLFGEWPLADGRVSVQLDFLVQFEKESERRIHQSLAGWGRSHDEAVGVAFENFNRSTLHILLGAFFPEKKQDITVENWDLNEKKWKVYFESIVYLCSDPETKSQLKNIPLFDTLKKCLENETYNEKTNWVSFFVSGNVIEVLLNNEPWTEAKEIFAKLSWPQTGQYFSARIFVIFIEE